VPGSPVRGGQGSLWCLAPRVEGFAKEHPAPRPYYSASPSYFKAAAPGRRGEAVRAGARVRRTFGLPCRRGEAPGRSRSGRWPAAPGGEAARSFRTGEGLRPRWQGFGLGTSVPGWVPVHGGKVLELGRTRPEGRFPVRGGKAWGLARSCSEGRLPAMAGRYRTWPGRVGRGRLPAMAERYRTSPGCAGRGGFQALPARFLPGFRLSGSRAFQNP
jgi:hypothetical protein